MCSYKASDSLPQWDLTDLYQSIDDPSIEKDIAIIHDRVASFKKEYKGTLKSASGDALCDAIVTFEHISEAMGRVATFTHLTMALNSTDAKIGAFYQNINDKVTSVSSHLLFFSLEVNAISDALMRQKIESSDRLRGYEWWLRHLRARRKYQLPHKVEAVFCEKDITGSTSWQRLFDQTMAGLVFIVDGKTLNESEILHLMSDKDATTRENAIKEMGRVLRQNISTFSLITNTLAKDKEISDRFRGFKTPVSSRNLENLVEDDIVVCLVRAVKERYADISHRYYRLKAKWMSKGALRLWDRNAPLPQKKKIIDYRQAKATVLGAYQEFSPRLGAIAEKFFVNDWIDAGVKKGKRSGAFSHPSVPSSHPYILLNYQGNPRDVMTLAHEIGHGCHQILAASKGHFGAQTPLTLAETASIFGEMLVFEKLLKEEGDKDRRRLLLAEKVEDMINTIVRQIAFFEFEYLVHSTRKDREVSAIEMGEMWLQVTKDSLGDGFIYEDFYKDFWSYIPHFIHSPFYVYAYAFGCCLVNTIYAVYRSGRIKDFPDIYLDILSSGGTKSHRELLKPLGLNVGDAKFWHQGLDVVSSFIDSLERM